MRTALTTLFLAAGVIGAHTQQPCDDYKERLDEALRIVKLDVDLTYQSSDGDPFVEYVEGVGDAKAALGCRDGVVSQVSGTSYEQDKKIFHKYTQAVLIALGVEKSARKAETIANRIRTAAAKAESESKWEEIKGFTVEVTHFGGGGEQFRIDPPEPKS